MRTELEELMAVAEAARCLQRRLDGHFREQPGHDWEERAALRSALLIALDPPPKPKRRKRKKELSGHPDIDHSEKSAGGHGHHFLQGGQGQRYP